MPLPFVPMKAAPALAPGMNQHCSKYPHTHWKVTSSPLFLFGKNVFNTPSWLQSWKYDRKRHIPLPRARAHRTSAQNHSPVPELRPLWPRIHSSAPCGAAQIQHPPRGLYGKGRLRRKIYAVPRTKGKRRHYNHGQSKEKKNFFHVIFPQKNV